MGVLPVHQSLTDLPRFVGRGLKRLD
jgi:hypothetical protein